MDSKQLFNAYSTNLKSSQQSPVFGANTQTRQNNGLAQKIAYANWINGMANELYYGTDDPRERANAKLLSDSIRSEMPGLSERAITDNYENIIHKATGNNLNATGLFDVFGQKIAEGYKSFGAGVNAIAYTIDDATNSSELSDVQKEQKKKKQDAYLSSISGKVRTDYYNEYDNFVQKAILGLGDTLPSLLNSAPSFIGAMASSATGVPLFYKVGKGVSDTLNFVMEMGSLVQTLRETGASPNEILSASLFYAGISTAIEHNFDKIPETILAKPAGQFLRLYREQNGLGVKAVVDSARKAYASVGKAVVGQFLKAGTDWVSETGEEVLQQLAEDFTVNLLSDYRKSHGEEALPDYITKTSEEIGKDMVETFKQMGTTQSLISTITALTGLGFSANFGSIKQLSNSTKYTSKSNNSYMLLSNEAYGIPSGDTTLKNGETFSSVAGKNTSIGFIPANAEEAKKVGYIKKADTDKNGRLKPLSSMQVTDHDNYTDKEKATKDDATRALGYIPFVDERGKSFGVRIAEDGTVIVADNNIGNVVKSFIGMNYGNYEGINESQSDGNRVFNVTIGDKTYTFSADTNMEGEAITGNTVLAQMAKLKGERKVFMEKDFETNLRKEFANAGIDDIDKAVEDYTELTKSWSESIKQVAEQVRQANPEQKFENLEEQLTYGMAGLTAKFQSIAGYDSEWAKNHIVIDPEMVSDKDKKGKLRGGTSYWLENGKKVKTPTNRDDAVFHVALSKLMNETTGIHEIAHMSLALAQDKFMKDDYFKTAFYDYLKEDNNGIEDETQWKIGDATHEAFAEKLEAYIETGVADNKQQASLFRRILNAFKALYDRYRGSMTDDQLEFYDRLFGNNENYEVMRTETEENAENDAHYFAEAEETEDEEDAERGQRVEASQAMQILNDIHTNPDLYKNEEGKLLAPNGEVSNYNDYEDGEYLYALVRTENFKRWFGDWENDPENASKVVDENGEPLLVYHHTNDASFNEFRIGTGNYYVNGIYFMESKKSTTYGEKYIEAFLDIKNPNDVGSPQALDSDKKAGFIKEFRKRLIPAMKVMAQINSDMFDYGTEGFNEWLNGIEDILNKRNTASDILKSATGFASHIYLTERGKKLIDTWTRRINTTFTKTIGIDGFTVPYKGWYIALQHNQIKSSDNNGNFNPEDNVFRNQTIHQEDLRKIQEDFISSKLNEGEILPYHEVVRYKDRLDIAMADVLASTIATDGDLQWMQKHLLNVIQDYLGTKTFSWDDISDEDWQKIAKNFMATAKDDRKKRAEFINDPKAKKKADRDPLDFSKLKTTDNPEKKETDPALVLKRLLAWTMHLTPEQKYVDWLNKFSGKNAKAGDKNIIQLAQRLEMRGEFDDKADFDGEALSQRFPFLNRVLKEAYRASDRHYLSTNVAEATYLGAQQEIIDNARELWEIDTGVANIYNSRVNKEAVEDTDINAYYNNVTERDLRKARAKADEYRQQTEKMQMELNNVLNNTQAVWDRLNDVHSILVDTATKMGIDWTDTNNDKELAELIAKNGSQYKADAEIAKAVNEALESDYREKIAENEAKEQELRIAIGERLANNIALRSMQIASDKEIKRITSELGQKTEALITEKAYSTLMNAELKSVQKKLGDAIVRLDSMREKYNNLGNKYDDAIDQLRQARKEATYYLNEAQKSDNKLKKMDKQSEADLKSITKLTMELIKQIDKSEKLQQFLAVKEDEIENLKVERQVNESKRQWKKKLEQKTGDAILDRALRKFSKVFFQSMKTGEFQPYDILSNPEMFDALSQTEYTYTDKKGIPHTVQVKSVMDILTEAGLAVDGELVKGFNDLELKYFKQMSQALNASRQYSNKLQQKVEQARQANVDKVVNDVMGDIGDLQLSKKDEAQAQEDFADGKYNSLKEARQAIYAEKMKYVHEGTGAQKNSKSKMGFNERKGLNPNNNLVFNSFTSLWNMLGSVSKKLRDAFYFGTGKLLGINQLTDEYHRAVDKRTNIPKEAIEKKYGKKNAIQKFMKDAYKKVETRQLKPEDVKGWIAKQETWAEIAEDQYNDYDPNYVDNTLTLSEVMAIYEHAKQDADIKHILNDRTNINAWQMAWIVEQFENDNGIFHEYKEIADAYQQGYEEAFDRLQHVANTVYGRALTRYEYYSPARTASSEKDTDISLGFAYDSEGNPVTFGNNRLTPAERAEFEMKTGGANPINLDYIGGFRSVVQGQEWFINTAEFFKTWNDIMKNEGGGLRKEIEDKFGSGVAQNIIKSMRAVASSEFYDVANGFNRAVDFFRNNMALANLGFSLSSTLQQPAVLAFGFAKFGAKNMFKALSSIKANGGIKEFIKHVHELAPQIKMTGDVNLMYANQALDTNPVFKGIGVLQDVARWGMKGIEALDQFSRCVLWEAGYQKYLEEGKTADEASVRATQDTMNMNSSRQAKDNSLVYNSKNPLIKMMFLFTNQLNKQWNMLIGEDGLPALKEKRIKEFASTVLGLAFATTWVLMAKGKFFNNDDEDEKWWEDLWEDYFGEGISIVPFIGEKISAVVNGYAYIDSDLVRSTSTLFKQLMADDKGKKSQKVRTATKNALVDLSELLGAPKLIVKNTYNALVENGKWKGDEYFTSGRYWRQVLPYEWYQFVQEKMK